MSGPKWRQANGKGYLRPSTGESLPGVTTMIKPLDAESGGLIGWATKTAAEAAVTHRSEWEAMGSRDEALSLIKAKARQAQAVKRDLGTLVHADLEAALRADLAGERRPTPQPALKPYRDALESFMEETGWSPLALEVTVLSTEWGYAGTFDGIGQVGSEVVMVDWKSGSLRPVTMPAQMALYQAADVVLGDDGAEVPFLGADRLWVVQITPGAYAIHEVTKPEPKDLSDLLASLAAIDRLGRTLPRLIERLPEPARLT